MGYRCFVENCRSGYDTSEEKVPIFKVTTGMLEQWRKAIPPRSDRVLRATDHVCAKHFLPDDFALMRYYAEYNGHVLLNVPKKNPKLMPTAVPSIFPGSQAYLSERTQECRESGTPNSNLQVPKPNREYEIPGEAHSSEHGEAILSKLTRESEKPKVPDSDEHEQADVIVKIEEIDSMEYKFDSDLVLANKESSEEFQEDFSWQEFLLLSDELVLPSRKWAKFVFDEDENKQTVCFAEAAFASKSLCSKLVKQVSISYIRTNPESERFAMKTFILNKEICHPELCYDFQILLYERGFQDFVNRFHNVNVCSGEPRSTRILVLSAYLDDVGALRHVQCPMYLPDDYQLKQCRFCQTILERQRGKQRREVQKLRTGKPSTRIPDVRKGVKELHRALNLQRRSDACLRKSQMMLETKVKQLNEC